MSPNTQSAFGVSVAPISLVSVLVLVALVYLRGWFQLRSAWASAISAWRLCTFMAGLLSFWAAVGSPLATLDHRLLSMHMVQHLLLMAIAPPLILFGAPFLSLRHGLPSRFVGLALDPLLRSAPIEQLGRFLVQPLFCWLIATAVLIGWHFPKAFDLAMQSESWHAFECASFWAAGVLFWMPVIQPWPSQPRSLPWLVPLYLFLATLPCDALSAFLTFCGRVVYPHYLHALRPFNISALQDQESAGALMWVSVTFIYLIPAVVATIHSLSPFSASGQREANDMCGVPSQPPPPASAEVA